MIASIQSRGVMVVLWTQIHDRFNKTSWGVVLWTQIHDRFNKTSWGVVLWTQIHDRFNTKSWGYGSFMDTNT